MLKNYVAVYVPSTNGVIGKTRLTAKQQAVYSASIASKLSSHFGGATAIKATGSYVTDAGKLVNERITIVKAYHDSPADLALEIIRSLAVELKAALNQEAVTIKTEAGIDFI